MAPDGILSPVIGLFTFEIWKPMKKHFTYCLWPQSKVCNLAKAAEDLKDIIDTMEEKLQLGERESKRPTARAKRWMESARSAEEKSRRIKEEYETRSIHIFGCSWNCFFNYRISHAATKAKADVHKLEKRTPPDDSIFSLLPPVGRELPLPPNIVGQNEYKEEIVCCIKQGITNFLGICGMGGVGKTTLLKQVNNIFSRASEAHEFDHVIYLEVGQQQNLGTIQQNIASQLGLTLGQDENTTSRSAFLYNFLRERKFLLLLDDLWLTLDLAKVGIPQGYGQIGPQIRQIIIITSRLQHVCHMQPHGQVILLRRLNIDEAWSLFEANVGDRLTNSSTQIRGYAESIVQKCGGLPLALKIVGQAMASKTSEYEWEHSVMLLGQSQFHKVPDAENGLYPVLYISYDHLPDERTKQCFLLFALTTHELVYVPYAIDFWMGHGLLGEDGDVRNSYLQGHSVVGCLKRACLLEEHPRGECFVRMHDIVKDLAIWIVQTQKGDGCNNNWIVRHRGEPVKPEEWSTADRISLRSNSELSIPDTWACPRLLTLVMKDSMICKLPTGIFVTAPSLSYLNLARTNIVGLPPDIGALVNLQYLNLSETPIQSIPVEFQLLKSLKYLYLGYTIRLRTIPVGTISALSMLMVLDMYKSGAFLQDKTGASIEELESLTFLQFLGFTVTDHDSLHRIFNLSKSSLRYLSIIGAEALERLHISPILVCPTKAQQLDTLALYGIENLEELMIGGTNVDTDWHFKILDCLLLIDLPKLRGIELKGVVPHTCFPILRLLQINGCHGIRTITWIKHLPYLEELYLAHCDSMLELVAAEHGNMSSAMTSFPRLKVLGLCFLGGLKSICDGTLVFPSLQRLIVYKCPMLEKLPSQLFKQERIPLILGERDWWAGLVWDDTNMDSLFSFFRELPATFQGNLEGVMDYRSTVWHTMQF